jgi:hypothetical protein
MNFCLRNLKPHSDNQYGGKMTMRLLAKACFSMAVAILLFTGTPAAADEKLKNTGADPAKTAPMPAPYPAPAPERSSSVATDKEVTKKKPLECPQCGLWDVGDAGYAEMLFIDNNRIVIPGCGSFDYKTEQIVSTPKARDRNPYKVSLQLIQKRKSFLCDPGKEKNGQNWHLEAEVDGHFQEGGTASFMLRKDKSARPTLWLSGWNMDRENPCDAGSAYGSIACFSNEETHVYRALSQHAEWAYKLFINRKVRKLPDFNAARFSAIVDQFCVDRERDSGGGSWPHAWASNCQLEIMKKKYKEFVLWEACMEKTGDQFASCRFPNESFNRSAKKDDEE